MHYNNLNNPKDQSRKIYEKDGSLAEDYVYSAHNESDDDGITIIKNKNNV